MRTYALEDRGSTPLYEYLYRCIREDILAGALAAGERLPSKRALAEHLHISVMTVSSVCMCTSSRIRITIRGRSHGRTARLLSILA